MTLTVELTAEEIAAIAVRASAQGMPVDQFVRRVLRDVVSPSTASAASELPVWPGAPIGSLRREEIYEDAE